MNAIFMSGGIPKATRVALLQGKAKREEQSKAASQRLSGSKESGVTELHRSAARQSSDLQDFSFSSHTIKPLSLSPAPHSQALFSSLVLPAALLNDA